MLLFLIYGAVFLNYCDSAAGNALTTYTYYTQLTLKSVKY